MPPQPELTPQTRAVLYALQAGHRYGQAIARATGVTNSTLYAILRRLEETYGWVVSEWEVSGGRFGYPPRRFYRLTDRARKLGCR